MDPVEVVVVGCVGVDTNAYLPGADVDLRAEGLLGPVVDAVGQAGGYSARGFAALGRATRLVASVGDDPLGSMVRRVLAADGVDAVLAHDPLGTHRSVNLVTTDGARRNVYDARGSSVVDADPDALAPAFAGARLVVLHLEDWCRRLVPAAVASGAAIATDLQDVRDLADPYRADFVRHADVVFLSAAHLPDPEAAARSLAHERPGRVVVVGLGADGCLAARGDEVLRAPAIGGDAAVVDTNGAGDALAVGVLDALVLDGLDLTTALARGQRLARLTCERRPVDGAAKPLGGRLTGW
ncbi:MAG TPA: carbohydrate kinase family protein [Acidimicrobiales bacterium]|nr:carbohydrate kinase family protein [Acidimicrobiales bacterium]